MASSPSLPGKRQVANLVRKKTGRQPCYEKGRLLTLIGIFQTVSHCLEEGRSLILQERCRSKTYFEKDRSPVFLVRGQVANFAGKMLVANHRGKG
jgi:hypothetical protein